MRAFIAVYHILNRDVPCHERTINLVGDSIDWHVKELVVEYGESAVIKITIDKDPA